MSVTLELNGHDYQALRTVDGLACLDAEFVEELQTVAPELAARLQQQRAGELSALALSHWLVDCSPYLEQFIARLFGIESAVKQTSIATLSHAPILAFKQHFVLREARRCLRKLAELPSWQILDDWLNTQVPASDDRELAVAEWAMGLLAAAADNQAEIEQLVAWCAHALDKQPPALADWVSFRLPKKLDFDDLIGLEPVAEDALGRQQLPIDQQQHRDGFDLTEVPATVREVQAEVDYCVYCHDKEGDFCSKGFPIKKSEPEQGLKTNPLGEVLTGCPLEEKVSEMQQLKQQGHSVAALAVIMVDNPMVPATGHRICNDCMKACIYQKQEPVNIPQIETRVLTDVLALPWGVEIYDLLARWNPLRSDQWRPQAESGKKVAIMGMGPAGFTLAHHLLMAGHQVVGFDGLKIEPLPQHLIDQPVYQYSELAERLDQRVLAGFGGVAEYGITVRWDKNYLRLIYLTLMRRQQFQVFGNVRFGGTLTVEDAWVLGFDHFVIAVGAGLPKALPIPGSLAPGMRQANDFLMSLQLTGAAKQDSLANLQVRLPAVVIGSGLTAVDAATEVQAYYIAQVEKVLTRYQALVAQSSAQAVRAAFSSTDLAVLDELLQHGQAVRTCRAATPADAKPDFHPLLVEWGGVTIVYRRRMQDSPAYRSNYEELTHALAEGVYYREQLTPEAALLDESGCVQRLRCRQTDSAAGESIDLPARCILVATGASPNIAYYFEHRDSFVKQGQFYQSHKLDSAGQLQPVTVGAHCKDAFGPFTSYAKDDKRITYLGDAHPNFHGTVVKAIASAKLSYPQIDQHVRAVSASVDSGPAFAKQMADLLRCEVVSVVLLNPQVVMLRVRAPLAARNHAPGQFYRLQTYESAAAVVQATRLHMEALSLVACDVDKASGEMSFYVVESGASSRLVRHFQPGDAVALMGPTGVRTRIPNDQQTVCFVADQLGLANVLALAPTLRAAGNKVVCLLCVDNVSQLYALEQLLADCDQVMIASQQPGDVAEAISCVAGDLAALLAYWLAADQLPVALSTLTMVHIQGRVGLIKQVQQGFQQQYAKHFATPPEYKAAVHGPMQCMLKGVCAQCLQWQIDPRTGERTKAVFACSWQDEPLALVDVDHLQARHQQNSMQEVLSRLWVDAILDGQN